MDGDRLEPLLHTISKAQQTQQKARSRTMTGFWLFSGPFEVHYFDLRSIILEATQCITQCKLRHSKSFTFFSGPLCLFFYFLELVRSEKRVLVLSLMRPYIRTYIYICRSEKKRQIDIIDLKALPHNDRVYFEPQNHSPLLQDSPPKWTSNHDCLFLSLRNNQGDHPPSPLRSPLSLLHPIEVAPCRAPPLRSHPKTDGKTPLSADRHVAK